MARFDAATAVEALEYDFTAYGGQAGRIDEPDTGRVTRFFHNLRQTMSNVAQMQNSLKGLTEADVDKMSEDELADRLSRMEQTESGAVEYQRQTIEQIALLCGATRTENEEDGSYKIEGGSPSFEDLNRLPFRVLQAFMRWLIQEIQPKKETPGTKR